MPGTLAKITASIALASLLAAAAAASAAGPFGGLAGSWSGSGQVRLEGGRSEALKCKAYYTDRRGGSSLGIALRCASASNRIELRATLEASGSRLSGNWEERTFNAAGSVSGQVSANRISLTFSGGGLSGSMAVNTSGASQTVSISTSGAGLQGVSIGLSKD